MNSSLAILQKLKNQFFESGQSKTDIQIAFAPLAFSLTNEDFSFLRTQNQTGDQARKFLMEQSEFAFIANSILRNPFIWTLDSQHLLYFKYADILKTGLVADPDTLSTEESDILEKTKKILFLDNGEETLAYQQYKKFANEANSLELALIDLKTKKTSLPPDDSLALERITLEIEILTEKVNDFQIEWEIKEKKSYIENAKKTIEKILKQRALFLSNWNNARQNKVGDENFVTDLLGVEFMPTTCLPNSIGDYQSNSWKKIEIKKTEIEQLATIFQQEIPASVLATFGNSEPEIESITFEYCFLDILRFWFDEKIINNNMWKFKEKDKLLSSGDANMLGEIPAYPVKLILTKNIDLVFSPNSPVNEDIKKQLVLGNKLFFGNLALKNIPQNIDKNKVNSYKVHDFTSRELQVLNSFENKHGGAELSPDKITKLQTISTLHKSGLIESFKTQNHKMATLAASSNLDSPKASRGLSEKHLNFRDNPKALVRTFNPILINTSNMLVSDRIQGANSVLDLNSKTFSFSGEIKEESQFILENCEVILMNTKNAISVSLLTDQNGKFSFTDLHSGMCLVRIKKKGYEIYQENIEVMTNISKTISIAKAKVPVESFQVIGVVCKKLPFLPNPDPSMSFI